MTNRYLTIALVFSLVSILGCAALAQYESSNKSIFGVRASMFCPSDSELADVNDIWLGPTVDYNMKFDEFDRPNFIISASFFSEEFGYYDAKMIPITASAIQRFGDGNSNMNWYVGSGVGMYSLKYGPYDSSKIGASFFGGIELSGATFIELRYDVLPKMSIPSSSDIDFSGLSLSIGTRIGI
ncbi:MAG: hypothetical protein ABFD49_12015 [Armatimonadota bacterium]|nr:hypothetical protein [bacterium]